MPVLIGLGIALALSGGLAWLAYRSYWKQTLDMHPEFRDKKED